MSFPQPGCLSLKLLPCSPPTNPLTSEMLWLTHSYPITHHPCCFEGSTSEIRAPRVCAAAGNIEKGLWALTGPAHTAPFLRSVIHPQNRRGHNVCEDDRGVLKLENLAFFKHLKHSPAIKSHNHYANISLPLELSVSWLVVLFFKETKCVCLHLC
jgi:hypothetical protein